jgi:hypothetical protein
MVSPRCSIRWLKGPRGCGPCQQRSMSANPSVFSQLLIGLQSIRLVASPHPRFRMNIRSLEIRARSWCTSWKAQQWWGKARPSNVRTPGRTWSLTWRPLGTT